MMFLVDAITEKNYLKESIDLVTAQINSLINSEEEYVDDIDVLMNKLEALCKKYQQFFISIERTKRDILLDVDGTKLSLPDAVVILNTMKNKLSIFYSILNSANKRAEISTVSVDLMKLFQKVEVLSLDIKVLKSKIDQAMRIEELK